MSKRKRKSNKTDFSPKQLLRWLFLAGSVILVSVWAFGAFYTFQKYYDECLLPPLKIVIASAKYISANEEEDIHFSIKNNSGSNTNVSVRLENSDSLSSFVGSEGSNIVYSGNLRAQEQINRRMRVLFPMNIDQNLAMLGKNSELSVWGNLHNSPSQKIAELVIDIAPFPWTKSQNNYLGTALAGLALWFVKELWNQVRETDGNRQ